MDVKRFAFLRRVESVDLSLFLQQVLRQLRVDELAHAQRVRQVFPHLLLFQIALPLLDLKVLAVDLVEYDVHLLLLA